MSLTHPAPAVAHATAPTPPPRAASPRLLSLDAFRGLTILLMLMVNNTALGQATPRHLTHAEWTGRVHLADLVFPWFLLIVGVALPFSFQSHQRRSQRGGTVRMLISWLGKALRRTGLLLLLGCLVVSAVARQPVFSLGVLQIIGLAYLIGALCLPLSPLSRLLIAGLLLVLHWALIRFLPIPGQGAGVFSPDVNAIAYLNETYLAPWNLNGLISAIPTGALVLLGTLIGDLLRRKNTGALRPALEVAAVGAGATLIGLWWSADVPMNKPLWTAPYILFTGGIGALLLALLYGVMDAWGRKAWAFALIVAGGNAMVAYVAPILFKTLILQTWTWPGSDQTLEHALQNLARQQAGSVGGGWLYTAGYVAAWWLALLYLHQKRWYLRV